MKSLGQIDLNVLVGGIKHYEGKIFRPNTLNTTQQTSISHDKLDKLNQQTSFISSIAFYLEGTA